MTTMPNTDGFSLLVQVNHRDVPEESQLDAFVQDRLNRLKLLENGLILLVDSKRQGRQIRRYRIATLRGVAILPYS